MCSWQLVRRNSNYLSESLRDSTGVLPIRQQKVNASQSPIRLIQTLHFSLLFMLYIGAKMMQVSSKVQKWKYKASILNNAATLVFWVYTLVMAKPLWYALVMAKSQLGTYKLWQNHNLIYPSYGNTITCRHPLSSVNIFPFMSFCDPKIVETQRIWSMESLIWWPKIYTYLKQTHIFVKFLVYPVKFDKSLLVVIFFFVFLFLIIQVFTF